MKPNDLAIQFILHTTWSDLPSEVQHQGKRCLLDLLGALIAGSKTPVAGLVTQFVLEQMVGDKATIISGGRRASATGATLANGFAANALDIDDGYRPIKGHPGACVLPALLAATELRGHVAGKEFLTALIVGYEIGIRAGLIRHALITTYHSSGSWGALAAAAVAARVLGLDAGCVRESLGTAEYHAPIAPMMKSIDVPCMGKDSIGWGGMVGIASALMAQRGFTGISPFFDEAPEPDCVTSLGQKYEVMNLYFKPYACCRWAQPAVAGAIRIVKQAELEPTEIAAIRVHTFEAASRLSREAPRNTEQAQYNLSYPVAATLIDGELGPRQVLPPRIYAPEILSLAARIEVTAEPRFEQEFPAKTLAEVEIVMHDGRLFSSGVVQAQWQPPDSVPTDSDLRNKFHWLAAPVVGSARAKSIDGMVWNLDVMEDVQRLISECVVTGEL